MPEVLLVCRANLCRSPAAELMLRAALGPDTGVRVSSAGLRPVPGTVVPEEFVAQLAARGLDARAHRPRRLDAELVSAADLVVVMTRSQRSAVSSAVPSAVRRTVLLPEAADRVRADGHGGIGVGPAVGSVPDVEDPFGAPTAQIASTLDRIQHETDRLAAALRVVLG